MERKKYTIGLDIGTNSVGYSVVVDDFKVPSKSMKVLGNTDVKKVKRNLIGSYLFDEANTAKGRRLKRGQRRRYTRRRNRIIELQKIFKEEINKIDPNFFYRLDESFYVEEDKKNDKHPIFANKADEVKYHKDFPTIYFLRKHLSDNSEKADIRLIYLALAHIIKFRGNFLYDGELNSENISIYENYKRFIEEYNQLFNKNEDNEYINEIDISKNPSSILKQKNSKSKKVEEIINLYNGKKSNGKLAQFIKLIVGNQGNFKSVFSSENDLKLQITNENYENDLEELLSKVGEEYENIFELCKTVYTSIILSEILDEEIKSKAKLSSMMVKRYTEHKNDLKCLKEFIYSNYGKEKFDEFFKNKSSGYYASYIDGKLSELDFYKNARNFLGNVEGSEKFLNKIDKEDFLRKQRTFDNGVIPNQIHKQEMVAIIKNQQKYYPFLAENMDKLIKILEFRIPYYIGPLEKNKNNPFAWIERKNDAKITPFNFSDVVDVEKSAIKFIERMTGFDTYLPKEKVLPKQSLIYQKFMIFNELTKVHYIDSNGKNKYFDGEMKLEIFNKLFKNNRKVSKKLLKEFLNKEKNLDVVDIKGIEDKFNASFGTYIDLCKIDGLKEIVDNTSNEKNIEEIIKIITLFEDKEMKESQIKKISTNILNEKIIKELSRKKYKGWGNLSLKLINGLNSKDNGENKTILDFLISDRNNRNFMQLINDESLEFKEKIEIENIVDEDKELYETIYDLAGSPAIKKGILQSIKVVDELIRVMGYEPENIVIEMARENQETQKGKDKSKERLKKLEEGLKELKSDILKHYPISDNSKLKNDHLYLYYLQNGKDMYTGKEINIDGLNNYDIDHIIPQSFISDDSIDNKVLTHSKKNRGKSDDVPSEDVVKNMRAYWDSLKNSGLISERKYNNLTKSLRGGLTEADKQGFINRQLVETRQIIKHVASLLNQRYNGKEERVRIITLKSSMVSQFRTQFDLYKVREINDYHHAHDAYLNAVVANLLLKNYPNLERYFVYGAFKKIKFDGKDKATELKRFNQNLIKNFEEDCRMNKETGEIVWDKNESIKVIKKVIFNTSVNIVKKVEEQKGGFSKETVLPKGESEKLIRRKNHLATIKYGGFDSPIVAYSLAFKYIEKNKEKKKLLPVTIMEKLNFEKNKDLFLKNLGYEVKGTILKLPKFSLFQFVDGTKRLIASDSELQKGNIILLPEDLIKLVYFSIKAEKTKEIEYIEFLEKNREKYKELLDYILDFSRKYLDAKTHDSKIIEIYEKHKNDDILDIAKSFINLFKFTEMRAPAAFKFFDEVIDRRRYRNASDIVAIWEGIYISQSCTGLYETRIDMRK